jgi:hypothetical protein
VRIAILLPMVWSVRNVVHAGTLRALSAAGVEAHLLMRDPDTSRAGSEARLFDDAAGMHPLLAAPGEAMRGKALLDAVVTSAFHRRYRNRSHPIYRRWFARHDGPLLRLRGALVEAAGRLTAQPALIGLLERASERMTRYGRDLDPIRRQLRAIDPDLIWSTVNVSGLEQPYRLAARDLGIPVVASILSFDNLTSRGPLARDDAYFVWGARMKAQLHRFYPAIDDRRIIITGTPQFDFHRQPAYTWPRERTLRELQLSPGRRYFLYGASHAALAPEEPALVARLAAKMDERPLLDSRALVVRLHPLDDPARWHAHVGGQPRVHLSPAFAAASAADGWALPALDDHARLTSSLAHADGCLNIASTLSLDAAILDRPIVCLDFATEPDSPRDLLFAEYGTEHYAPLVESGGLRIARSWEELLELMETAILHPARDRRARARMVDEECGPVDGEAARRVAGELARLAAEAARVRQDLVARSPRSYRARVRHAAR